MLKDRNSIAGFFEKETPKIPTLSKALYTLTELGLMPDYVDSVSEQQALFLWKVVETLKEKEFPEDFIL